HAATPEAAEHPVGSAQRGPPHATTPDDPPRPHHPTGSSPTRGTSRCAWGTTGQLHPFGVFPRATGDPTLETSSRHADLEVTMLASIATWWGAARRRGGWPVVAFGAAGIDFDTPPMRRRHQATG